LGTKTQMACLFTLHAAENIITANINHVIQVGHTLQRQFRQVKGEQEEKDGASERPQEMGRRIV